MNLAAIPAYKPTIADQKLEHRLTMLTNAQPYATDKKEQRRLCAEHARLHATRSPEYVAYLERKMGLI